MSPKTLGERDVAPTNAIVQKKHIQQKSKAHTDWLVVSTPLKNMKISWDDEIPNIWKVIPAMFQTTNQILMLFPNF